MSNDRFTRYCDSAQISPIQGQYTINQVSLLLGKSKWTVQDWAYGKSRSPFPWVYELPVNGGNGHWFVERDVLARYINSFQNTIPNLRIHSIKRNNKLRFSASKIKAIA